MSRPFIIAGLAIIALAVVLLFVSIVQGQRHLRSVQGELDQAKEQVVQSKASTAELEKTVAKLKTELDEASKARRELQENLDEATSDNEQLRKDIEAAQTQLNEGQANAQELTTELEKTKKETYAQLAAEKEANQRQFETITNEATKKLSETEKRVADLTEQLKLVSAERDATQAKLSDTQSELEKTKDATQEADAKLEATVAELEKVKEATEQANARVTELESAGANTAKEAETERNKLQAALDQANTEIERLRTEVAQQKATPPEHGNSVLQSPGEAASPPEQ